MKRRKALPARATTRKRPTAGKKRASKPKAAVPDSLDALVMGSAQALGLTIDPSWQAAVKFNLDLILRHAARVDEFPLADDTEPAAVFRA